MKKIYSIFFIFFLCLTFVYGKSSIPEFEALSVEKKVDTLLAEYGNDEYYGRKFNFQLKMGLIAEEREKALLYILVLMKQYNAHPINSGRFEIRILDSIISYNFFELKLLSQAESKELVVVYKDLLDRYLQTYKKIDPMAIFLQLSLIKFGTGRYITLHREWIERVYEYQTARGHDGLSIDYEELARVCGIK